jgi:hypothetical protein
VTKQRRAWVIRWDWGGDHARVTQPIVAILSPQLGSETVRRLVEALYAAREYTPEEMLEASRRGGYNPYKAMLGTCPMILEDGTTVQSTWEGEILCGHNPHLVARRALVSATGDPDGSVEFEDLPRPAPDLRGWRPSVVVDL